MLGKQKRLTAFFGGHSESSTKRARTNCSSKSRAVDGSSFGTCPLCDHSFPLHTLESHAETCEGKGGVASSAAQSSESPKAANKCAHFQLQAPAVLNRNEKAIIPPTCEPIPGLFLYENFITEEEEAAILNGLDHDPLPWKPARFNGKNMGKRWGVHCNLRDRRVDAPEHPLPNYLQDIVLSKLKLLNTMKCIPNEANAIDYLRKQGHWLQAHVDDRKLSKEPIANLSLAGDCYMTFRNQAMHRNLAASEKRVLLKRRCLQVLTGKARYDFSHGIAHQDLLSDRRVSVTMRESPLTLQPVQNVFHKN